MPCALAFNGNGKVLASAGSDATVRLWEVATGKQKFSWNATDDAAVAVAFSPDDKTVAAGCGKAVLLWNTTTGRICATLPGHGGRCDGVAFSPNGTMLATGGFNYTIKIWELSSRQERLTYEEHTGLVMALAFSKDSMRLASFGYAEDGCVKLWEVFPNWLLPRGPN